MTSDSKIGERIASLRKAKGFTGEKFAERLGVSPQAVSKWENGKCLPETALLPALSALLETSIDSILQPGNLTILRAEFGCGTHSLDVTQRLQRAVKGNSLTVEARFPADDSKPNSPAVSVLTVEYRTDKGTFYAFAPQGEWLTLDAASQGLAVLQDTPRQGLTVVGAYYGTGAAHQSVLHKMEHYEFFHRDDIHVNHETFPSSPEADDMEYLTLVYGNQNGLQVVSCVEGGVLCYNENRTAITVKDTSSCILQGITLPFFDADNTMACTWAGALVAALGYMGENVTYEQIMGMSGACFRICFCEVWDWSALDALVAFPYDRPLYHAIGYTPVFACRLDKDERPAERRKIVSDILQGKPVPAINLRVAAEWGVITGYSDNGKKLYCRTYFDKEGLQECESEYLETENWPFIITHFGAKHEKPSPKAILMASLRAMTESFNAPPRDGYFQGRQGYEQWIKGLENPHIWHENCPKPELERRYDVHLSTLHQLTDARRCAARFLTEYKEWAGAKLAEKLENMAAYYRTMADELDAFKGELHQKGVRAFTDPQTGQALRERQGELLRRVMEAEEEFCQWMVDC